MDVCYATDLQAYNTPSVVLPQEERQDTTDKVSMSDSFTTKDETPDKGTHEKGNEGIEQHDFNELRVGHRVQDGLSVHGGGLYSL